MKVLVITGDKRFGPGNERYELQKAAVEELHVVYWGKGSYWPRVSGNFDVVTAQDPFWRGLFGVIAARRTGARFNVQVHTDLSAHSLVRHVLAQIVLRHADSIRVVSEKIKKQVEHIGVRGKVSVLPIYVNLENFSSIISTPHLGKNILWIGRLEEEKNPLMAIDVLKEVLKTIPEVRLIMLGSGSMTEKVKEHASLLPINEVIFTGWVNPASYLDTADVVLCTSWHESFGASIVEALAAGVPVVAPDVGIAREAGADVVEERDTLAEKVIEVLREGKKGNLKLSMPTADEWTTQWLATL